MSSLYTKSSLHLCNVDLFHHFLVHLSKVIQKCNKTNVSGKAARALPPCKGGLTTPPTHTAWCQHSHTAHTSDTCFAWIFAHVQNSSLPPLWYESVAFVLTQPREALWWIMPGFSLLTKALFSLHLGGLEGFEGAQTVAWQDTTVINHWLKTTAGLVSSVVLAPHSLEERKVALCAWMFCVLIVSAPCFPLSIQQCESYTLLLYRIRCAASNMPCMLTVQLFLSRPLLPRDSRICLLQPSGPPSLQPSTTLSSIASPIFTLKCIVLPTNNLSEVWICNHIQKGQL